jgi:uncharacterized membrane protein YebE (DUF533 family)
MIDYRKLLDAVVGAVGRPNAGEGLHSDRAGSGKPADRLAGQSPDHFLQQAKDIAAKHPGLTQAALLGLAGLMFGKRKKSGLPGGLVKLGGLAVIGGLAYKALQKQQAQEAPIGDDPGKGLVEESWSAGSEAQIAFSPSQASPFHPLSQTEDDALLFLRAMVAAAASDGQIDDAERGRIVRGLMEAGIDPQASRWLEDEMASPADVEELASGVDEPEKAAQVYAAARIAIDPDTIQEREFLHQLADALDLDPALRVQIEDTVATLR